MKYFDQPVKAFKSMNDYKKILGICHNCEYEALEKWIHDHEKEIADLIIGDGLMVINSEHVVEIVVHCLEKAERNHIVHFGILNNESWLWVEVIEDNYIIEPLFQLPDACYNNAKRYAEPVINKYNEN